MGWLTKTLTKGAQVVAKPVVTKTLAKAAAAGHTDLKTADELVKEIGASAPIQKFAKESATILKVAAATAVGFGVAGLAAGAGAAAAGGGGGAAAAGGGIGTTTVASGTGGVGLIGTVLKSVKVAPPTKSLTAPPAPQVEGMGLLQNIIKKGEQVFTGAKQVLSALNPTVEQPKIKVDAQAQIFPPIPPTGGPAPYTGVQNMGSGSTPDPKAAPWYKQVPVWAWVTGGFSLAATILYLIFRRKR